MKLKIELRPGWVQMENPNGPATFGCENGSGAFQVSWAEYRGGELPAGVTPERLKQMAENFGRSKNFGMMGESSGGNCPYGMFGTAVFRSLTHARIQAWFISDGRDHIMATHICTTSPNENEIAEV